MLNFGDVYFWHYLVSNWIHNSVSTCRFPQPTIVHGTRVFCRWRKTSSSTVPRRLETGLSTHHVRWPGSPLGGFKRWISSTMVVDTRVLGTSQAFAVPRFFWFFLIPQNFGGDNPMWFNWVAQPPTSLIGNQDTSKHWTIRGCATVYLSNGMLVTTCSPPRENLYPPPTMVEDTPLRLLPVKYVCYLESVRYSLQSKKKKTPKFRKNDHNGSLFLKDWLGYASNAPNLGWIKWLKQPEKQGKPSKSTLYNELGSGFKNLCNPTWGNDPVWRICLNGFETTSYSLPTSALHRYTPQKMNIDTKNDGLEHVAPFKYGYFGYLYQILGGISDMIYTCSVFTFFFWYMIYL